MSQAIGIDLGTTYSCVAHYSNNRVEIITNDQGNRTTPSFVSFSDTERLVGDPAKNQAALNPENIVFDAKRLIGRKFADPDTQKDIKHFPFKVLNKEEKPVIEVTYKGKTKLVTPEEISSMVLSKMKQTAEAYLGNPVKDAVITVPAYFNDSQRQATKDAALIAGLNPLRIINEPTAAAIAYGLDKSSGKAHNVLVFDLGGGTFDISLLSIGGGRVEVKATAGDTHLGGEDFDDILVDFFVAQFKRKHKHDISGNSRALRRLRSICERAKRALSTTTQTAVELDSLYEGIDFYTSITRARFEELCYDLFQSTLAPIEQVLADSKLEKSQVKEIIMVGGSTRIPKIQKLVSEFFSGRSLNYSINPDEAVAYGAAVQAFILKGGTSTRTQDMCLVDVTPLSLGVKIIGSVMSKIVQRNSTLPIKLSQSYTTAIDNQTSILFQVYEGERGLTKDNNLLGKFTLAGITPAPRGEAKIEVTFNVDVNGILYASARDRQTGNTEAIKITNDKGRLSKKEIDRMVSEAEMYKRDDDMEVERVRGRDELEACTARLKSLLSRDAFMLSVGTKDISQLEAAVVKTVQWLDDSWFAALEDFRSKKSELERLFSPFIVSAFGPRRYDF